MYQTQGPGTLARDTAGEDRWVLPRASLLVLLGAESGSFTGVSRARLLAGS